MKISKKINKEVLIQQIILVGLAFFFYMTLKSNIIAIYLHPRLIPLIGISIGIFLMMIFCLMTQLYRNQPQKKSHVKYFIFVLPLVFGFVLPNTVTPPQYVTPPKNNAQEERSKKSKIINFQKEMVGDTIVINDQNYLSWVNEIYQNTSQYLGKKIIVTGFVYRQPELKEGEFILARLLMTCCAADVQTVGFRCSYSNEKNLQARQWLKIEGELGITKSAPTELPLIRIERMQLMTKPKNEYLYPY